MFLRVLIIFSTVFTVFASVSTTADPNPFCGGFAAIQCDTGYCVDDPSDDCDIDNGGADCGGICVSEGDSCDDQPDCETVLCPCSVCADGSTSYGCCGSCSWRLNDEGTDVVCDGYTSAVDTCPEPRAEAGQAATYYDWQSAYDELTAKKALWEANGITHYVYNWTPSCYCMDCWVQPKYIVIINGVPVYVEFDTIDTTCTAQDISTPLSDNFNDITALYDAAIAHAQQGLDTSCVDTIDSTGDMVSIGGDGICDGSITFAYDVTLYYPTTLSLDFGPYVADGGMSHTISCLSPLNTAASDTYTAPCDAFTMSSEGDECGTAGIDCVGSKCACGSCDDDSGNTYGCCDNCYLVESTDGELLCAHNLPQDVVCPASNCGGFAGIQCDTGLYCVDDPSDDCDADTGGADCGGICVLEGDPCDDQPNCLGDCDCTVCGDASGSYGCCGCSWGLNDDATDLVCNGYISQDDVCPDDVCICTMEYSPWCCGITTYGNICEAGCGGYNDTVCNPGECDVEDWCDDNMVSAMTTFFDNSDATDDWTFDRCQFCLCRETGHPSCDLIYDLFVVSADTFVEDMFNIVCTIGDFPDVSDADGNQCDWLDLMVKSTDEITSCSCDALYCKNNPDFKHSGVTPLSISIGCILVILVISWL